MPIVSGKMVALQRYDPVTDSYRLSGSGSREHPKGHVDGADRQGATGMSAGGGVLQNSKGATYDESLLRRQNAALAQHVDTLRHSNQEAWEQYRIGTHTHSRSAPVMPSSEDGGVETFFEGEAAA